MENNNQAEARAGARACGGDADEATIWIISRREEIDQNMQQSQQQQWQQQQDRQVDAARIASELDQDRAEESADRARRAAVEDMSAGRGGARILNDAASAGAQASSSRVLGGSPAARRLAILCDAEWLQPACMNLYLLCAILSARRPLRQWLRYVTSRFTCDCIT